MTAKKKTLIELMMDAGIKPEDVDERTEYFVSNEPYEEGKTAVSQYSEKPVFSVALNDWYNDGYINPICITKSHPANWKSTIITKQQFIDAYNEKNKPVGNQQKTLDEAFCEPVAKLNVTVENNTQHTVHADLSDVYTEKLKREFYEAGKHCALTPSHYSVINGKDLIDRSAESYKTDEFRGAMRFNIEKYIDRLGKKDSLVKELRKIADYANRWADYEEKLQGSK
mgnify:CR=1 FL=1